MAGLEAVTKGHFAMRALVFLFLIIGLAGMSGDATARYALPNSITVYGADVELIILAMPEFRRMQNANIALYEIDIADDGPIWTVFFRDPDKPVTTFGSRHERPQLSVEISKVERRVIRAYINR